MSGLRRAPRRETDRRTALEAEGRHDGGELQRLLRGDDESEVAEQRRAAERAGGRDDGRASGTVRA
jgi:hypothetical protein